MQCRSLFVLLIVGSFWGGLPGFAAAGDVSLEAQLDAIEARCPTDYGQTLSAPPTLEALDRLSIDQLVEKLDNWSPAYRLQISKALSVKGSASIPSIVVALDDPNYQIRCGAATALRTMWRHYTRDLAKRERMRLPVSEKEKADVEKVKAAIGAQVPKLIELLDDPQPLVVLQVANLLGDLGPAAQDAADKMLEVSLTSPDWVGGPSMRLLDKYIGFKKANPETVLPRLMKMLHHPKPRARGHAAQSIRKFGDRAKAAIPDLIWCIENRAPRDSMFGDGSRMQALQMLSNWKVKEGIPLCIDVANEMRWGLRFRRPAALKALAGYGTMAKHVAPDLEKMIERMKTERHNDIKAHIKLAEQTLKAISEEPTKRKQ